MKESTSASSVDALHAELRVLFDGPRYFVVDKPTGMLVHRGMGDDSFVLTDFARQHVGGGVVYPIHRLDRPTSGVLLFARDCEAASVLGSLFQRHGAQRRYVALARGVAPSRFVVDHPVPRSEGGPRVAALTVFRSIATVERYTWLEAWPQTGRFHQIRRHAKHVSHPLIGDVNYGKSEHNRRFRSEYGLHRLALHAASLRFECPFERRALRVDAPLPADLRAPLERFGFTPSQLEHEDADFDPRAYVSGSAALEGE